MLVPVCVCSVEVGLPLCTVARLAKNIVLRAAKTRSIALDGRRERENAEDWGEAVQIPIGLVTGNALAAT